MRSMSFMRPLKHLRIGSNKISLTKVPLIQSTGRYLSTQIAISPKIEHFLKDAQVKHESISVRLSRAENSPEELASLGKEYAKLAPLVTLCEERNIKLQSIHDLKTIEKEELLKGVDGEELAILAKVEREEYEKELHMLEGKIIKFITPKDEDDEKGIILDVRAGTGGDEASLFASEVFKMYQKYAIVQYWKLEQLSFSKTEIGGFKEAQALINGNDVYKHLKFESGVHRVQRIPVNDTKIQTSAASVIVMPEVEEVDYEIRPQDLKIDVFRAGGAGGQSVNRTESAVRMTHIPTGITISMQDERSQIQNRARALKYLRAKVYDLEKSKSLQARNELRSKAQGTGDRSDKIRTYNVPQDRVTDHRIGLTVPGVARVLAGEEVLSTITYALMELDESDRMANFLEKITNS